MTEWRRKPKLQKYGIAVLAVGIALAIALVLKAEYNIEPWHPFLCAIIFGAWLGGVGPGLLATVFSLTAFYCSFLNHTHALPVDRDLARLFLAALTGLFVVGLSSAARDASEALRESEGRIRLIINTIPMMAWSVRSDGTVDFLNQRWLEYAGLTQEEYVKDPLVVIHPEDVSGTLEKWQLSMATGEPYEDEIRLRRADGKFRWFLIRTAPLRDDHGGIIKWFGCSIDIEDRRGAEETLLRSEQQLHSLVGRLNTVREDEARRIARELHDDLGQKLTALNMGLADLGTKLGDATPAQRAQLARMHATVDATIDAVHELAGGLRLGQLDILGLTAAIEWQLKEFSRRSRIPCTITRLDEIENLYDAQSTAAFRILQEALTNIVRHAGATRVEVSLQSGPAHLVLEVRDNGRGITAGELHDRRSIGLLGMRERAQAVGGTVSITGEQGRGTAVVIAIPVKQEAKTPA